MLVDDVEQKLLDLIQGMKDKLPAQLPRELDLSKMFGVSVQTIQNALHRLKKKGLVESSRGRGTFAVKLKKSSTYVLLVPIDKTSTYSMLCLSTLSSELKRQGYIPIVSHDHDLSDHQLQGKSFRDEVLGAILIGAYPSKELEKITNNTNLNMVLMGDLNLPKRNSLPIDHIATSLEERAYLAATYLIHQGHRSIATAIVQPLANYLKHSLTVWQWEIVRGCQNALRDHGIEPCPDWGFSLEFVSELSESERRDYLNYIKQKNAEWQNPQTRPTALIHGLLMGNILQDTIECYFPGFFPTENQVGLLPAEGLNVSCTGLKTTTAVCYSLSNICLEAINCLRYRQKSGAKAPARHIVVRESKLWRREQGVWRQEEWPLVGATQEHSEPCLATELAVVTSWHAT